MMENNIVDYEQGELETVDSYIHQTHFEDAPFYHDEINDSDEVSIDRLLRRSSKQFTEDVLENIDKKLVRNEFAEEYDLGDVEFLEVFGTTEPEETEGVQENGMSLVEPQGDFRKAA